MTDTQEAQQQPGPGEERRKVDPVMVAGTVVMCAALLAAVLILVDIGLGGRLFGLALARSGAQPPPEQGGPPVAQPGPPAEQPGPPAAPYGVDGSQAPDVAAPEPPPGPGPVW